MTNPKPPNQSSDAVTTPVGVTTMCPQCGTHMPAFETQCSTCGAQLGRGSEDEQRTALRQRLQAGIGDAYELLDMLGKGGMGVVFRAREKALDREVALKVLAFDPIMAPDAFARFEREAKLAARLDHPNIVPIFAVGQGRGIAFYTMRLVRGGSLEELLAKEGKIDVPRAIGYLRDVAAALDHAHAHGVVHRDVKPANVMLGDGGHVFVADFGIARAVEGTGPALTTTGVVGSPAYMAPEQWQGLPITGSVDQYALGILAYELLTGKRPYRDATMHELLRLHLTQELPDISQELPTASPEMRNVLRRATAKEPSERFPTASDFVKALERAAGPRARPTPALGVAAVRGKKSGSRTRNIAAAMIVLLAGAGGLYAWQSRRSATIVPPATPAPAAPESIVVPETVRVAAPGRPETVRVATPAHPETVRVATPSRPETVRVGTPVQTPNQTSSQTPPAPALGPAGSASVKSPNTPGVIIVGHPLVPRGQVRIDSTTTFVNAAPATVTVAPGPHLVTFHGPMQTIPPRYTPNVKPGDTVRLMFLPAEGGGARGDSLRTVLQERLLRATQPRGRGGRGRGN